MGILEKNLTEFDKYKKTLRYTYDETFNIRSAVGTECVHCACIIISRHKVQERLCIKCLIA